MANLDAVLLFLFVLFFVGTLLAFLPDTVISTLVDIGRACFCGLASAGLAVWFACPSDLSSNAAPDSRSPATAIQLPAPEGPSLGPPVPPAPEDTTNLATQVLREPALTTPPTLLERHDVLARPDLCVLPPLPRKRVTFAEGPALVHTVERYVESSDMHYWRLQTDRINVYDPAAVAASIAELEEEERQYHRLLVMWSLEGMQGMVERL